MHVPRLSLENLPGELWSENQLLEHAGCVKFAATQLGATRLHTSMASFPKSLVAALAKGEARLRDEASFGENGRTFFESSRLSTPAARTIFDAVAEGDGDWVTDGATTQDPFELPASGNPFDVPEWADRSREASLAAEATAKKLLDQAQIQSVQANMSALVTSYQAEFPKTAALVRRGKGDFATLDTVHPTFLVIVAKHFALCDKLSVLMRKSAEEWKLSGAGPLASRFSNRRWASFHHLRASKVFRERGAAAGQRRAGRHEEHILSLTTWGGLSILEGMASVREAPALTDKAHAEIDLKPLI
jgi:hypothetical protein